MVAEEYALLMGFGGFLGLMSLGRFITWWERRLPDFSHLPAIVKGNTPEFKEAKTWVRKIIGFDWRRSELDNMVRKVEDCTGEVTWAVFMAVKFPLVKLPKPFSCPDLEFVPTEGGGIVWFCGRIGCLCSPVREDLEGDYPDFCPDPDELYYGGEDDWDDDYADPEDYYQDYPEEAPEWFFKDDEGYDHPEDERDLEHVEMIW